MRILFVCRANVCRSPAAAAIFNALAQDAGLGSRAESAGVSAMDGARIPPESRAALEEMGVYAGEHRARRVRREMLEGADLVLTMSRRQTLELSKRFGEGWLATSILPSYATGSRENLTIPDPYGSPIQVHRSVVRDIYAHTERVVRLLEKRST